LSSACSPCLPYPRCHPGAGTLANGDGSRQPSAFELGHAEHQGKYTTGVIAKIAGK